MPSIFAIVCESQISLVYDIDKWSDFFIKLYLSYTLLSFMQQAEYLLSFFYFGSVYLCLTIIRSKQRTTKTLCGCAAGAAFLLIACGISRFSHDVVHISFSESKVLPTGVHLTKDLL